jgi:hypothetical protein
LQFRVRPKEMPAAILAGPAAKQNAAQSGLYSLLRHGYARFPV